VTPARGLFEKSPLHPQNFDRPKALLSAKKDRNAKKAFSLPNRRRKAFFLPKTEFWAVQSFWRLSRTFFQKGS
jgi:hypothetical protein